MEIHGPHAAVPHRIRQLGPAAGKIFDCLKNLGFCHFNRCPSRP
ncbi:MAG: hypothetical protein E4G94_04640 [ANME-2 cluster archaeon]|nr:MAG: hypothetical protein E4G94_04640 [ANME-2 cluster archaeon]